MHSYTTNRWANKYETIYNFMFLTSYGVTHGPRLQSSDILSAETTLVYTLSKICSSAINYETQSFQFKSLVAGAMPLVEYLQI